MTQNFDSFERTELFDEEYVVAKPTDPSRETVQLRSDWFDETDQVKGEWESVVGRIVRENIGGLEAVDSQVTSDRQRIVDSLVEADDGELPSDDWAAHALVEYFADQGALEVDGDDVVVLRNPDPDALGENARMVYGNWAATMRACIDAIEGAEEEFEAAEAQLKEHVSQIDPSEAKAELKRDMNELLQEMKSFGPGPNAPKTDEELANLSDAERARYDQLRQRLYKYRDMLKEYDDPKLTGHLQRKTEQIADKIQDLNHLRNQLETREKLFRSVAAGEMVMPEEKFELVNKVSGLFRAVSGLENTATDVKEETEDERIESMSEIESMIGDESSQADDFLQETERMEEATEARNIEQSS